MNTILATISIVLALAVIFINTFIIRESKKQRIIRKNSDERIRKIQEEIDKNDKLIEATKAKQKAIQEKIKANDKLIKAYEVENNIMEVDFSRP